MPILPTASAPKPTGPGFHPQTWTEGTGPAEPFPWAILFTLLAGIWFLSAAPGTPGSSEPVGPLALHGRAPMAARRFRETRSTGLWCPNARAYTTFFGEVPGLGGPL